MKRHVRMLLAAVILALACWAAYRIAFYTAVRSTESDAVGVNLADLSLGDVWEDTEFPWKLRVQNLTSAEVVVDGFDVSCGCLKSIEPKTFQLAKGESIAVALKLNLAAVASASRLSGREAGPAEPGNGFKQFSVRILPRTKQIGGGELPNSSWVLSGRVKPALVLECPKPLVLEVAECADKALEYRAKIRASIPLRAVQASSDAALFEVGTTPMDSKAREATLLLKTKPAAPAGRHSTVVELRGRSTTGETLPPLRLAVELVVAREIQAIPDRLLCAVVKGQTLKESILLVSTGEGTFVIDAVTGPAVKSISYEVDNSRPDRKVVRISHRAERAGVHELRLEIQVRTARGRKAAVSVTIDYLCMEKEGRAS